MIASSIWSRDHGFPVLVGHPCKAYLNNVSAALDAPMLALPVALSPCTLFAPPSAVGRQTGPDASPNNAPCPVPLASVAAAAYSRFDAVLLTLQLLLHQNLMLALSNQKFRPLRWLPPALFYRCLLHSMPHARRGSEWGS